MLLAVLNPGLVRLIILFLPPLVLVKVFIPLNISSLVLQLPFLVLLILLLLLLVLKFAVKVAGHLYPSVLLLVILLLLVLSVLWVLIGAVQHVLVVNLVGDVLSALPQPSLLLRALQLLVNLGTLLVQLLHRTEDVDGDLAEHLDDDGGELVEAEER